MTACRRDRRHVGRAGHLAAAANGLDANRGAAGVAGPDAIGASRLCRVRPRAPSGRFECRRLLRLCAGQRERLAAALQRRRVRTNRYRARGPQPGFTHRQQTPRRILVMTPHRHRQPPDCERRPRLSRMAACTPGVQPHGPDVPGRAVSRGQGSAGTGKSGISPVSACMKATRSSSSWPSSSTPSISRPMTTIAWSSAATSPLLK